MGHHLRMPVLGKHFDKFQSVISLLLLTDRDVKVGSLKHKLDELMTQNERLTEEEKTCREKYDKVSKETMGSLHTCLIDISPCQIGVLSTAFQSDLHPT